MLQTLAAMATLLAAVPHGNRIELQLDRGAAEINWLTGGTFHFRRSLNAPLPSIPTPDPKEFDLEIEDTPAAVRFRTKYLEVSIRKKGVLLAIYKAGGAALTADLSEPRESGLGVEWERQMLPGASYYGLGPRTALDFELRGKVWPTDVPFLLSTAGYGESHLGSGAFRFDFTAPDRYRIHAPSVDYLFHYGPALKQILEVEHDERGTPPNWKASTERTGSWTTLRDSLLRIVHGALSGRLEPELDLEPYASAPAELKTRARQLGSLVRNVSPGSVGVTPFREQLETFLRAYAVERDDRGYPLWHPLPFQFPSDPECEQHADEFMFGDEMLVAPIYQPGNRRTVYLPPGTWTNLDTNEVFPGRRSISVETASLPVFVRNGMIVPLDSPDGMTVHYFPKLGGEFFVLEADFSGWTQLHASPAVDIIRLEIESQKPRDYQWIVHHIDPPAALEFDGRQLDRDAWFYDKANRNLHVRLHLAEKEDRIVNIVFP